MQRGEGRRCPAGQETSPPPAIPQAREVRRVDAMNILTVNLLFSTLVFGIAARIYVVPRLHQLSSPAILTPILLLHGFRHLQLPVAVLVGQG